MSGASPQFDAVERVSADGSSDYYTRVGSSNTYIAAPGDGAQLTKNANGTFTLLDSDGAIYGFDVAGTGGVAPLLSAELVDASKGKGALAYTYTSGKLSTIDAGGGAPWPVTWGCTTPAAILCVTGPDAVKWSFIGDANGGSGGKLVRVNDGVRDIALVGYDGSGRVNSVKNANDLDPTHASPGYNGGPRLDDRLRREQPRPGGKRQRRSGHKPDPRPPRPGASTTTRAQSRPRPARAIRGRRTVAATSLSGPALRSSRG